MREARQAGMGGSSYNPDMARGWESKSVEEQQAEAIAPHSGVSQPLSPEQQANRRQQEELALARKYLIQRLQAAQNPQYHKMLEDALLDLDAQLARLG